MRILTSFVTSLVAINYPLLNKSILSSNANVNYLQTDAVSWSIPQLKK